MFISYNRPSFHLWWKENLVNHRKVSKYYETDCRSRLDVFDEQFCWYLVYLLTYKMLWICKNISTLTVVVSDLMKYISNKQNEFKKPYNNFLFEIKKSTIMFLTHYKKINQSNLYHSGFYRPYFSKYANSTLILQILLYLTWLTYK